MRGTPAEAVLLGTPNTEAAFVLDRWGFAQPEIIGDVTEDDRCVIVDTNNVHELPPSINDAQVIEIIDHHLIQGGLKTRTPIAVTVRPLACTATIMHQLMGDDAERMPDEIRGLMLSCILSDTLEFRSPTTTDTDKSLAEKLAGELGVDISGYAAEMFAAKSDVSAFSAADLLRMDSKEYEIEGTKLRISVLESTAPATVLSRKAELLEAMPHLAQDEGLDEVLLFVIDILKEEATLLLASDRARSIAEKSFGARPDGDQVVLPGIMSRKKQIIPAIRV
jgi:manganese-dependent inorganic pyrophosphatase